MPTNKSDGVLTKKLSKIYTDIKHPASFGSAKKLASAAKVTLAEAKEYLRGVDAHTLHRERRKNFERNRYVIPGIRYLYEADLCDMQHLKEQNKGYTFLLNCIDCYSRFLWCVPLKNKKATTVLDAFKIIFGSKFCKYLQVDMGREFDNAVLKKYLAENNVKLIFPRTSAKCSIVERVNRTLKLKIHKYFTHNGTQKYIDVLDDIVKSYNTAIHSSTGHKPSEVTKKNQKQLWNFLYGGKGRYPKLKSSAVPRKDIKVGSFVRISRDSAKFSKGYEGNWGNEIFKVTKIIKKPQTLYEIADWNNEKIDGRFNYFELQVVAVTDKTRFRISKILKTVGSGRSRRLLVSWTGFPESCNSYIYERDLKKL
jgi:hypothetical protein